MNTIPPVAEIQARSSHDDLLIREIDHAIVAAHHRRIGEEELMILMEKRLEVFRCRNEAVQDSKENL